MRAVWSTRRRRAGRQRQAGFTLIELLVALFVFAIATLAIAAMTFMSIRGNAMTNQVSQANFLAQEKMEELLAFRERAKLEDECPAVATVEPVDGYVRTRVRADGPTPASYWLTVTVGWSDGNGAHQVVVRSLWREF